MESAQAQTDSQASREMSQDMDGDNEGGSEDGAQTHATKGGIERARDKPLPTLGAVASPAVAGLQPARSESLSTYAGALQLNSAPSAESSAAAAAGVVEVKPAAATAPLQDSGTSQDSAAAHVIDGPATFAAFETALRIEAVKCSYHERIKDDAIQFFYDKKDEFDTANITFFGGRAASGRITVSSLKKALKESRADVSEQTYSQFAADFDDFGQRSPNAAEPSEGDESEVATPPTPTPPTPSNPYPPNPYP